MAPTISLFVVLVLMALGECQNVSTDNFEQWNLFREQCEKDESCSYETTMVIKKEQDQDSEIKNVSRAVSNVAQDVQKVKQDTENLEGLRTELRFINAKIDVLLENNFTTNNHGLLGTGTGNSAPIIPTSTQLSSWSGNPSNISALDIGWLRQKNRLFRDAHGSMTRSLTPYVAPVLFKRKWCEGRLTPYPTAGCKGTLTSVGEPEVMLQHSELYGAWMTDPVGTTCTDNVWFMSGYKGNSVPEYSTVWDFQSGWACTPYTLPQYWAGTGHVMYNGSVYYTKFNSRTMVKYNLATRAAIYQDLPSTVNYNSPFYRYKMGMYTYTDFAVDEKGLWIVFATPTNQRNMVVAKLDPETLQITDMWNTSYPIEYVGNTFMICGVLYTITNYRSPSYIHYVFDTNTGDTSFLNVSVPIQTNLYSLDYNPRDGFLYGWDSGKLVIYNITFDTSTPVPAQQWPNVPTLPSENDRTMTETEEKTHLLSENSRLEEQLNDMSPRVHSQEHPRKMCHDDTEPPKYNQSGCGYLTSVSAPTLQKIFTGSYYRSGTWMQDPVGAVCDDAVYILPYHGHSSYNFIEKYTSMSNFNAGHKCCRYSLPHQRYGTGHVMYNGSLYYSTSGTTNNMVKYDLTTRTVTARKTLPGAAYSYYQYKHGANIGIDFALDEEGLWVIYATSANSGKLVISKLNPDDLSILKTWQTDYPRASVGEAFMMCGVLYTLTNYKSPGEIHFFYNTHTSTNSFVNIPFTFYSVPGHSYNYMYSLDYNPKDKKLYAWYYLYRGQYRGHLVTYDIEVTAHI
ncbi:noelin-2-like [Branchiostoma floridae]|uniref:Noelin-2-like n=1 Tax=Branchiostoma floridae TaxID=7739 RepID=A0A9J7LPC7_BRAFL|nr:noelin-2-like [Branchiostoma floridae]